MNSPSVWLTPLDIRLLDLLSREPTLVAACRSLGISRDRGAYRLRRLRRALGRPVVASRRGGEERGRSRLTALGVRLLDRGTETVEATRHGRSDASTSMTVLRGVWESRPQPSVVLSDGTRLFVDFLATPDHPVRLSLNPEAVLLASRRYPTSARNVLDGVVTEVRASGPGTGGVRCLVTARVGEHRLTAAVTRTSVRNLRLRPGRRVVLYIKATAFERVGAFTRRHPRS